MLLQQLPGLGVGLVNKAANLGINFQRRLLAEVAMLVDLAAQEDLLFFLAEGKRSQAAHAPLANHLASHVRGALNVVAGAGGHLLQEELLAQASAHQHGNACLQIIARVVVTIGLRQLHGQTHGHAARNDRHLVQRIGQGHQGGHNSVACLVEGGDLFFFVGQDHAAALGAHHDLVLGNLQVVHQNGLTVLAGGQQCSLVDQVGQIGAAKARSATRQHAQIHIVCNGNLAGVHAEDLLAAANIRQVHYDAAVKATGAQQRRVQHVRTVSGGDKNDAFVRLEAIHLHQQLVQGLLAFVVSAAQARATMAADGVNFVNKNDAGSVLFALLKQVAHAACAHAHEHLHKVRAGDGEERHIGLTGDGARQQGFARARRSHQQNALRNASAELLELLRFAQELDDLVQLFLGLVYAGHVLEGDLLLLHAEQAGAALAKAHGLVAAGLHLADHQEPQAQDDGQGQQLQQPAWPSATAHVADVDVDALVAEALVHIGVAGGNGAVEAGLLVVVAAAHLLAVDGNVLDFAGIHVCQKLREVDLAILHRGVGGAHQRVQQNAKANNDQPERNLFDRRIHRKTPLLCQPRHRDVPWVIPTCLDAIYAAPEHLFPHAFHPLGSNRNLRRLNSRLTSRELSGSGQKGARMGRERPRMGT